MSAITFCVYHDVDIYFTGEQYIITGNELAQLGKSHIYNKNNDYGYKVDSHWFLCLEKTH